MRADGNERRFHLRALEVLEQAAIHIANLPSPKTPKEKDERDFIESYLPIALKNLKSFLNELPITYFHSNDIERRTKFGISVRELSSTIIKPDWAQYVYFFSLKIVITPQKHLHGFLEYHRERFTSNPYTSEEQGFDYFLRRIIFKQLNLFASISTYDMCQRVENWISINRVPAHEQIQFILPTSLRLKIIKGIESLVASDDKNLVKALFSPDLKRRIKIKCEAKQIAEFFRRIQHAAYINKTTYLALSKWLAARFLVKKPGMSGFDEFSYTTALGVLKLKQEKQPVRQIILPDIPL